MSPVIINAVHVLPYRPLRFAALFLLCLTLAVSGQKASAQDTLEVSVVSADRLPSATLQSAPMQVMDRSTAARLGLDELHEAVRTFSGVQIKDYGGIGGIKTVSVRSLGAQHTAVVYDGVAVSDAQNGQIDIGRFTMDNISRVLLSIGGSDDIFKSARSFSGAGTLIINSSAPFFKEGTSTHLSAALKTGSYDLSDAASYSWNPSLNWQQKLSGRWSLNLNGDWLRSKGEYPFSLTNASTVTREKRTDTDVNTLRTEINIFGESLGRGRLHLKGSYMDSERGLPGSVILYNPTSNERLAERNGFFQGFYENELSRQWALQARLKYDYSYDRYHDEAEYYPGGQITDEYTRHEYYASAGGRYTPSELFTITLSDDAFGDALDETIPDAVRPVRFTNLTSLAGRYRSRRLTVTASALSTYVTERLREQSPTREAAPDRYRLSPAVSLSWKVLSEHNLRLRVSYQDIFRNPTFNELYYARVGNKDLRPETARQMNIGLTWNEGIAVGVIERFTCSVDGYYNKVEDKIVARPTLFIWKMRNIGEVDILGCDISLGGTFILPQAMSLEFTGSYTYQYAVDVTDPDSKTYRNQIPYTPRHSGSASLSWLSRWINVSYLLSGVSERWSMDQNTDEYRLDPYLEHSVTLHRLFHFRKSPLTLNVSAECRNITDEQYEIIQYYPMPGRSWRLNLKLSF